VVDDLWSTATQRKHRTVDQAVASTNTRGSSRPRSAASASGRRAGKPGRREHDARPALSLCIACGLDDDSLRCRALGTEDGGSMRRMHGWQECYEDRLLHVFVEQGCWGSTPPPVRQAPQPAQPPVLVALRACRTLTGNVMRMGVSSCV
jgi:hypothetical protein